MTIDPEAAETLRAEHTAEAVRARLSRGAGQSYLKDSIYGAIDGAITTFAVVCGVAGAELSAGIVLVLGSANLFADGFSMAVSNFMGTRAEEQVRDRARRTEENHIELFPEGEREEVRQIFERKGFSGDQLEQMVELITSNKTLWVNTMLQEELGLPIDGPSPIKAGFVTFISFLVVGALPLISFLLEYLFPEQIVHPFEWSLVMTGVAFFLVGAGKSWFIEEHWAVSGTKTLALGLGAAAIAYGVGVLLKGLV